MRFIKLCLALLFFVFAVVQLNDPDPALWVVFYVFIGIMCALAAFNHTYPILLFIGLGTIAIWLGTLIPGVVDWINKGMPNIAGSMKAETPYIELVREFFGLFISAITLIFLYFQRDKITR